MTPAERIERAHWDFWWIPEDVTVHDEAEVTWLSCERPVHYLNSVYRTRIDASEVDGWIDRIRASTSHGGFRWMITDTWESEPVARALEERGFVLDHDGLAVMLRTSDWDATPRMPGAVVQTLDDLRDATEVQQRGFARDLALSDEELEHYLAGCTGPEARVRRVVVRDGDGRPLSTGGLNLFPDLSFGLLWGGATVPEGRGRGAYTAVMDTRIRLARALGIEWVGMYAMDGTSAPIALGKGFEAVGRMRYLQAPALG